MITGCPQVARRAGTQVIPVDGIGVAVGALLTRVADAGVIQLAQQTCGQNTHSLKNLSRWSVFNVYTTELVCLCLFAYLNPSIFTVRGGWFSQLLKSVTLHDSRKSSPPNSDEQVAIPSIKACKGCRCQPPILKPPQRFCVCDFDAFLK